MDRRTEAAAAPGAAVRAGDPAGRGVPRFVRIRIDLEAVLADPAGGAIHGRVENLSVGGMFFRGGGAPEVGARVICSLIRTDGEYQDEFHAHGTVVHRRGQGVGIAFEEVTPHAFSAISDIMAAPGCPPLPAAGARPRKAPERRGRGRATRAREARADDGYGRLRAA